MKKLFVSILALSAFVACQSGFDGADVVVPSQNGANYGGSHTIYAEVGVGEVTKATYGDDFSAMWEEGDQLALLQEHADYGKTFSVVNKLNIKEGWGTNSAKFNGDISVDATSPRVYHIAYPAEAVTFGTLLTLTKNGESTYTTKDSDSILGSTMAFYAASANYTYNYTATLNVTVPTTQNGEWTPYMYASTTEAVSSMGIGTQKLTTLTGVVAIRAFEADGVTPKQLASVSIMSGDAPIAGAFVGTSESTASATINGAYTSDDYSTVRDEDTGSTMPGRAKGKAEADKLLASAAQSFEPSTVTATKSMSLAFAGTATTIEATNLENVAMDKDGFYTYHINVVPTTVNSLTIVATAVDGSSIVKSISNQTFKASARKGYTLKWEEATLTCGSVETWFDNYSSDASFNLEGSTIYANNIKVEGVDAENVQAIALVVGDQVYGMQSGVAEVAQIKAEGLASGAHTAFVYASVMVNGALKELTAAVDTYNVTTIPTVTSNIYSSYSKNGAKALNNDVYGNEIRATATLSDNYIQANLVQSATLVYGNSSVAMNIGQECKGTASYGAHTTSVKVVLKNGYTITSASCTTHVTGIPYHADWRNSDYSGWKFVNISDKGSSLQVSNGKLGCIISPAFHIPDGSCSVNAAIAASTSATSSGGYTTSYIYAGTQSSSATESGAKASVSYNSSASNPNTPLASANSAINLTTSNPCVVFTAKDFTLFCDTYVYQAKITY